MSLPAPTAPTHSSPAPAAEELPVIEVKNLVKEYRLGALEGLRSMARRLLGRGGAEPRQQFRALDDVNFSVKRGEVVGIIGHNGAGKSTLLKHLCRITTPTSGSVTVRGRVAPLIEVGAGLVGDMTGRENIYLNASILGLKLKEIEEKIDEIVDFAELQGFIDTPIKRFSSGMQARLGFAIATAVNCEVLIVDEVLAVGDISFQHKSLERIESLIRRGGCTVVIVGHNIRQLERVCGRLILLDHGRILVDGPTASVSSRYFEVAQGKDLSSGKTNIERIIPQEAVDFVNVLEIEIDCGPDHLSSQPTLHAPLRVRVLFSCSRELQQPEFVVGLHTQDFVHVVSDGNANDANRPSFPPGTHQIIFTVLDLPLRPNTYGLRLAILSHHRQILWNAQNILAIKVAPGDISLAHLPEMGTIHIATKWGYSLMGKSANEPISIDD